MQLCIPLHIKFTPRMTHQLQPAIMVVYKTEEFTDVQFIKERDLTDSTRALLEKIASACEEDDPAFKWAFDGDTEPAWFGHCELGALRIPPGCAVVRALTYYHDICLPRYISL